MIILDELTAGKSQPQVAVFKITEPEEGNVYPRVQAWHVDDARIPVRYVGKDGVGQYSVALEEGGPIIYWSLDESGQQVPHTTPPQDDGESFSDILINPISDVVNNTTTVQPMPEETDWRDAVLVFPIGSDIEPLYLVFNKPASDLKFVPAPRGNPPLPAFPDAKIAKPKGKVQGGGGVRKRWKDKKRIYEWDSQHGKVEVYDKNGNHIGEFDHISGKQTKPKDPKRKIEK